MEHYHIKTLPMEDVFNILANSNSFDSILQIAGYINVTANSSKATVLFEADETIISSKDGDLAFAIFRMIS